MPAWLVLHLGCFFLIREVLTGTHLVISMHLVTEDDVEITAP